jgi:hypothetical protein
MYRQTLADPQAFHETAPNSDLLLEAAQQSKASGSGRKTAFQRNVLQQIAALILRQTRLTIADRDTFIIRIVSNILNAVAVGAIAYRPPNNAAGALDTAGAIFFVIL